MTRQPPRSSIGRCFLWIAAVAGTIHAAFSLLWAVGGSWLLDTVGEGAVRLRQSNPLGVGALLLVVGTVKLAGAALPVIVERVPGAPFRRSVRLISWVGGCFLVVYGTGYALLSASTLTGLLTVSGEVDRRGLMGHALLWDPLFAIWGIALVVGLWLTRGSTSVSPVRNSSFSG